MKQNLIWSTQPIFISSTFSDMNAERDVLSKFIFPKLQEMIYQKRVRLEPIDYRWGIYTGSEKEKEQKELRILKVCLEDIDRSEPFFIGLIGDRYGWVPPEKRMKDAEDEKGFVSKLKNKSVTALEIEYGVLASKEQLKRSFFFFREPLPYDDMPADIKALYYEENPELQKRLQELKKEIIKSVGKERVFTYKADWEKQENKVTGLRYSLGKEEENKKFQKIVEEVLWDALDNEPKFAEVSRPQKWEEEEQRYLQDFIEDRSVTFSGREDIIEDLKKFALGKPDTDNWGLCLTGESGSGKSALIAKLYKELDKDKVGGGGKEHDIILLAHAAGISLRSNSLQNMLTVWIRELAEKLKVDVSQQLVDKPKSEMERLQERTSLDGEKSKERSRFEDLKNLFASLLSQAAVSKRVVILVDALNQFERTQQAKYVNWLPGLIPENTKIIFTAIPGEETEQLSKRSGLSLKVLEGIKEEDVRKIIKALCKHKELDPEAIEIILKKKTDEKTFSYSNPLWLTMVIDDFLQMDEDDFGMMKELEGDPGEKLTQLLIWSAKRIPPDVEEMYGYIFERCDIFGKDFVNSILKYIGISRNGLRESDLEDIITEYEKLKWDNLNFASFRRYMRSHIVQKGELGLWDFRHVKARESLKKSLLKDEKTVIGLHKNLSVHLDKLNEGDPLRLTEVIWHLFKCDDKRRTAEVYGSRYNDAVIDEYSTTLRDILLENKSNVEWFCSLIALRETDDSHKHLIINNVLFNLKDRIKDFIQLGTRLRIFQIVLKSSNELQTHNKGSYVYKRNLFASYNELGDIQESMGKIDIALENFESSLKICEELQRDFPDKADSQEDLATSYSKLGGIYETMGQLEDALKFYKDDAKLSEDLFKTYPLKMLNKNNLAVSYSKLGAIYESMGQVEPALKFFEEYKTLMEELNKSNSQNITYKLNLANSNSLIGGVYEKMGQLEDALEFYRDFAILSEDLHNTYPQDVTSKYYLTDSYIMLGGIYEKMGQLEDALKFYKDYSKLSKELHKTYPQDVSFKSGLAISYAKLGGIYEKMGELEQTLKYYNDLKILFEELHKTYPQVVSFKNGRAISYGNLCKIYEEIGELEQALKYSNEYNKCYEELHKTYPQYVSFKSGLACSYGRLGTIYDRMGDLEQALKYYEDYYKLIEELHKTYPQDVSFKDGFAISHCRLGIIYETMGKLERALKYYEGYQILFEELYKSNSQGVSYKFELACSNGRLGGIYEKMGELEQALKYYEDYYKLIEELLKTYPQNVSFKNGLAISYENLGGIYETMGELEQALKYYNDDAKLTEELHKTYPQDVSFKNGLAISYIKLAGILINKEKTEAIGLYKKAQAIWKELTDLYPGYSDFQKNLRWVQNVLANYE